MQQSWNETEYRAFLSPTVKLLEKIAIKFWWVFLFFLGCYMQYEQGMKQHAKDYNLLYGRLEVLKVEKQQALNLQEDLLLQISSQNDPKWVELTLMKGLGLVPDGQIKVLFTHQE